MASASTSTAKSHLLGRIIRAAAVVLLALAVLGIFYQNIALTRDRRQNPMPGKMVSVGGLRMHIDCKGEGTPTVILESGLGDTYLSWRKVQPQIAKFTRVCSYDRAGLGYSDPSSRPRTSQVIAEELHGLLQAEGIAPPYVLVGHSMGGFDVRLFASLYRNEVAGMVLVDSSHPDQDSRFPAELKNMQGTWRREAEFMEYSMPVGIPRLFGLCDDDGWLRAAECNWNSAREGAAEMASFSESAAQAGRTGSLNAMPLAVLSHDPDKPSAEFSPDLARTINDAWEKMQEELAHLSTRGTQTVAKGSAHYIQLDRPDIVIDAVRRVTDQAREPAPTAK